MTNGKIQVDGSLVDPSEMGDRTWRIHGLTDKGVGVTFTVEASTEDKALREARKRCILSDIEAVEA